METTPNRLIFEREARGLSQEGLAELVDGLDQANVSRYENGLQVPRRAMLEKIAAALEVDRFQVMRWLSTPLDKEEAGALPAPEPSPRSEREDHRERA